MDGDVMWPFFWKLVDKYRISSFSCRGNYSFLNLEIQRSQYIRPKVTVHRDAKTIQVRKLFKGGNYMRKSGRHNQASLFIRNPRVYSMNEMSVLFDGDDLRL